MCPLDAAFFWASYRVTQHFFHWIFVPVLHGWQRGVFSLGQSFRDSCARESWELTTHSPEHAGCSWGGGGGSSGTFTRSLGGFTRVCDNSVAAGLQLAVQGLSRSCAGFGRRIYYLAIFLPQLHGKALQRLLCIVLKAPIARSPVSVSASALRPRRWRLEVPVVELFFAPAVCN